MTVLAVAITALTGVLGTIFAQTQQSERLAAAATTQFGASNTLRLIESMDSRAQGALITVAAFNAGLTGETERDDAIAGVTEAENAIARASTDLFDGRLSADIETFIVLLENADTDEARRVLDSRIDPLVDATRVQATAEIEEASTVIALESGLAGQWGFFTSFGVGLLAPLLALGIFRLFVNRRRKQDELEQELLRIEETSQAKDDMIANLSHELRTPLTGIYGFALAMEDVGFEDPEFTAEMNSYIVRDAADLSRMVDDLLVAAKADTGSLGFSPEDISIEREIDEALVPFKMSEKSITKDVADADVHADRLRVRQILRNLISNADKHGGSNVSIRGRNVGDRYRLDVIDDGPGVSKELSGRLFNRFVHDGDAPLTTGSVGVGLSVAQALAVGMGGTVEHTQGPRSTVFTLDLPLAAGVEHLSGALAEGPPAPSAKPRRRTEPASDRARLARSGRKRKPAQAPAVVAPPPLTTSGAPATPTRSEIGPDPFA